VILSLILYLFLILALGPSLALEIRAQDVVSTFRKFTASPWDIDMAKELFFDSLATYCFIFIISLSFHTIINNNQTKPTKI